MTKIKKIIFGVMLFMMLAIQSNVMAVDRCDGIYSPGNPFQCTYSGIQGNCVWWAWHWLRYGKGDRNLMNSNSFRGSPNTWVAKARELGYTVTTTPVKDAVAVNNSHVASVDAITSTGVWVYEMNAGMTGFRRNFYRNGFFTNFIVPFPQPKLSKIEPSPIYKAGYDQNFILTGENMDKVTRLELTFPNGYKGSLSGSQLLWRSYNQLGLLATFGTSGNYIINAITDRNIESVPQMPFTVYQY